MEEEKSMGLVLMAALLKLNVLRFYSDTLNKYCQYFSIKKILCSELSFCVVYVLTCISKNTVLLW